MSTLCNVCNLRTCNAIKPLFLLPASLPACRTETEFSVLVVCPLRQPYRVLKGILCIFHTHFHIFIFQLLLLLQKEIGIYCACFPLSLTMICLLLSRHKMLGDKSGFLYILWLCLALSAYYVWCHGCFPILNVYSCCCLCSRLCRMLIWRCLASTCEQKCNYRNIVTTFCFCQALPHDG